LKPLQHTKKIIFLAFLLSLLFHSSSVIIVFFEKNKQQSLLQLSPEEQQKELEQTIKQKEEWAETKARAGNFGGAPVMFVDDPDEQTEPSIAPEKIKDEVEHLQENKPEKSIEENKEIIEEHDEISFLPQSYLDEATKDRQTSLSTMPPQDKKIIPKKAPQKKTSTISQIKQATSKPKPPLTLAQLTQGFLDHMKNEGSHAIHMLGKKSGRPSDEQIKYERYLQKLSWCLQNSYHIHQHRFPPSANLDDKVHVLLSLNKDGSLKHCQIAKTSGNRDLDNFTLFIFNDASSSFPPVPHYLPHDPFTMTYIIMVAATQENRFQMYRQ
jgi:outer membrane biosynthesis protein TonB